MNDDLPLFPVTQEIYMDDAMRAKLKASHGAAFAQAIYDGDILRQIEISDLAWQQYLRLLRGVPRGAYDPVTNLMFSPTASRSSMELLYRHYFGVYIFPRSVVPTFERAMKEYGIANLSAAFAFWRDRNYNNRNVSGITNYAKKLYEGSQWVEQTEVPAIFLPDDEEETV